MFALVLIVDVALGAGGCGVPKEEYGHRKNRWDNPQDGSGTWKKQCEGNFKDHDSDARTIECPYVRMMLSSNDEPKCPGELKTCTIKEKIQWIQKSGVREFCEYATKFGLKDKSQCMVKF